MGRTPIEGVSNHSLRRTFCAIPYESRESPAYVMDQMGHTDASLALEVYAKVITNRKRDSGARKPRWSGAFLRLRGRDSNPNFLIQSQASYH